MQCTFKVSIANDKRVMSIGYGEQPKKFEEFVLLFKSLMIAWGFSQETVDKYFDLEDVIVEYEERIKELELENERLKGKSFILHSNTKEIIGNGK